MGGPIKLRVVSSEEAITLQSASGSLAVEAVSPRAAFTKVDGGTRLDITDVDGTKSTVIPDGATGPTGPAGPAGERGERGLTGNDGAPGRDGVSPTANVTQTDSGAVVTVTDASGTTTAVLTNGPAGNDGTPGTDGISPTANVSKSGGVATITITDKNGTTSVTVSDGQNGQDGSPGTDGQDGADGVTFTPAVSNEGVISWTNDGGRTNPQSVNIRGPKGDTGDTGPQGDDYVLTAADKAEIAGAVFEPQPFTVTVLNSGQAIRYNTGGLYKSSAYNASDFVDLSGVYAIRYKRTKTTASSSAIGIAFYDSSKDYADSGVQVVLDQETFGYTGLYDVLVPDGAAYVRFTMIADTQTYGDFEAYAIPRRMWELEHKQDALTFDSAPTSGSTNPVTSGGVYTALQAKADPVTVETVSGTDPVIVGADNHRYVCGTVDTLTLTPPSSGIVDVVFTSGTTPTVLSVPSGIKWPDWFDPTALDASVTYEINIMDGLGAVGKWT